MLYQTHWFDGWVVVLKIVGWKFPNVRFLVAEAHVEMAPQVPVVFAPVRVGLPQVLVICLQKFVIFSQKIVVFFQLLAAAVTVLVGVFLQLCVPLGRRKCPLRCG